MQKYDKKNYFTVFCKYVEMSIFVNISPNFLHFRPQATILTKNLLNHAKDTAKTTPLFYKIEIEM